MSGLLSVIEGNPRRRSRRRSRRKGHSKMKARRRRRHHVRAANPSHRRHRRRRNPSRRHARRRHRNPLLGGGPVGVGAVIKGVTGVGVGAIGARLVANAVKNQFFPTASPIVKVGIEAAVGVIGSILLLKAKQRALAAGLAVGAGVVIAQDIYDLYVRDALIKAAPMLADYSYGSLQGWAPQAGVAGWAPQTGLSAYSTGTLQGDGDAYANGAFD